MDKISDMLTKIRNAQMAGHGEVAIPHSGFKLALAKILEKEGFVASVAETKDERKMIKIALKYNQISNTKKLPAITGLKKISKPGQRIYVKNKNIRNVKNKFGIAIVSTSKGIMTGAESRKLGLGGEYICEVW
jgi:small subunit ribosomal protein S8